MNYKQALIASTAICAAGGLVATSAQAAEKPTLKASGYYELFFGYADGDREGATVDGTPTYTGKTEEGMWSLVHYGEIRFKSMGKTDSGMKWGTYFESVAGNDAAANAKKVGSDEANIWLSGSWGKLEIGGQDGADDKIHRSAKKMVHINPDMVDEYAAVKGFADEDIDDRDSSDDSKFTYYSPRVNGFMIGLSFSPQTGARGSVPTNERANFEWGVDYSGKVGGGNLHAGVAGSIMPNKQNSSAAATGSHRYDWNAGFTYHNGPFGVGAGWGKADREDAYSASNVEKGDRTGYNVGVSYSGGRYEATLYWVDTTTKHKEGTAKKQDWQMLGLTGGYNLGGGLAAAASVWFFDLKDHEVTANDNKGTAVIFSLGAKF